MNGVKIFQNVILTIIVLLAVALLFSVAHDILLNKYFLYTLGLTLSGTTMLLKPEHLDSPLTDVVFFFGWLTPLFGCFVFGITAFVINFDLMGNVDSYSYSSRRRVYNNRSSESNPFLGVAWLVTLVWIGVAVYQNNWLVGIFAIIKLFALCGFVVGSMFGGYFTGFWNHEQISRCLAISILLNAIMLGVQTEVITGPIVKHLLVFETGVQLWGTMVGLIAMFILTDEMYIPYSIYNDKDKSGYVTCYLFMQMLMVGYCLIHMYFGGIFYISCFKSLGGTFLVLWGLDFQRTVLSKMSHGWITGVIFVLFVNAIALYKVTQWFPEYLIWG